MSDDEGEKELDNDYKNLSSKESDKLIDDLDMYLAIEEANRMTEIAK